MTKFYWVRHGPTHAKAAVGWLDLPADLSDTATLSRLDDYLPDDALVVSSDLVRASATADAIAGSRDRLAHRQALREMNYGDWDGLPFKDVAKTHPDLSRAFWEEPGDVAPPNGESWNGLHRRISSEIAELTNLAAGRSIVVVAHFGVILTAIQHAAKLAPKSAFAFKIDNLSVTEIDHIPSSQSWRVNRVNHHV